VNKLLILLIVCIVPIIIAETVETQINFDFAGLIPADDDDEPVPDPEVEYDVAFGETKTFGGWGAVTSYFVSVDESYPVEMGIAFSANSLSVLRRRVKPEAPEYVLALPDEAKRVLPFNFVKINYNPFGHEPAPIYGYEHFDVHFYLSDEELVDQVVFGFCPEVPTALVDCDVLEWVNQPVDPSLIPDNYQFFGNPIPGMGDHAIDLTEHGKILCKAVS
jgi:hypothetical protein